MKSNRLAVPALFIAFALTGCATKKHAEPPPHQRGWIGGQFKLAETPRFFGSDSAIEAFPKLASGQKAGIVITQLSSNTPAQRAGLRAGDLILALDGQPATRLQPFREAIDRATPGQSLTLKFWREGTILDGRVTVGRETFRYLGTLAFALPPILHPPDLWPDPDFSLVALGLRHIPKRTELGSGEMTYRRACNPKDHPTDQEWQAWLAIISVTKGKTILSQENVPPAGAASSR